MVLRKGDYSLFFLKPEADKFVVADSWFGHLSISRQLASPFAETRTQCINWKWILKLG